MPFFGPSAVPAPAAPERLRVLPNARVGKPYQEPLGAVTWAELPASLGLLLTDDGVLSGVPQCAGEFRFAAEDADGRMLLEVFVAPDPKSLWKNLPSQRCGLGWKPDLFADQLSLESHDLIVASRRGRSHAHKGGFRDDEGRVFSAGDWLGMVVADGAGSAECSRLGSSIAVATACESLGASLAQGAQAEAALIAAAEACVQALTATAECHGLALKSLYTTLLVVFAHGEQAYTLHIGDGLIAASDAGGGWQVLSRGDEGEFSNQTQFVDAVTVAAASSRIQRHQLAPGATLWAMTDGVSDAFFADAEHPQAFLQQFGAVHSAEQLLAALDFWQPGCHDDATLALVRPR